ncbi:MAG: acylneuraminate cytidylyltransferase family protein [Deltaproteobacteria bacterium]|jgi:N-acylneuraminate cytidylyltransferase|nr:acylneuraminate cytidylyltransferase family protein [Deltaproteobacteria bacterium]
MKPEIYAFVFARGGSKGLPGKNIKEFCGKPLLAWSLDCARAAGVFNRLIVSTDSPEIAAIAREYGAETPFMRPAELANDFAPEWLAWRHALDNLPPFDVFVSLPATAPLRRPETIKRCLNLYRQGDATDLVLTVAPAHRHPSFNMVFLDDEANAGLIVPPPETVVRRQDAWPAYDVSTVCYVTSPAFIRSHFGPFSGRTKAVVVSPEEAVDIDTPLDFAVAEFLFQQGNC